CQRESRPLLECSEVKLLNKKCTMLIRTLTLEQIEEIQEIINKNFSRAINDKQLPEALEFILEYFNFCFEDSSKQQKTRPTKAKVFDTYYVPDKSKKKPS
ncbi:16364_t:CDS:2, partial [Gigaspora rosea]